MGLLLGCTEGANEGCIDGRAVGAPDGLRVGAWFVAVTSESLTDTSVLGEPTVSPVALTGTFSATKVSFPCRT